MGWWVYLQREGKNVCVPTHAEGGTYVIGGTDEASMSITYNYGGHFRDAMGIPFGQLHEMSAEDALPVLIKAVAELGTARDPDYWAATRGNAGYALNTLLQWAEAHPDATFIVH